jgi:GDP-4-dehydro-6-deoxy-D-mannose reductase
MRVMRLLITGITGFVGSHMAEYAIAQGAVVIGSARWRSRTENIKHLRGQIQLIECDLRDSASVRRLLGASAPTHVIHLAAQSYVAASWHTPAETLSTNIIA